MQLSSPQMGACPRQGRGRCAVLVGSQRRQTELISASHGRFVIVGWPGLVLGLRLHLILDRGRTVVRECLVVGASAMGIELACVEEVDLAPSGSLAA
jgi:hypothetical protein